VEPTSTVKDTRRSEVVWLVVLAVLVAAGTPIVLHLLAQNRVIGSVLLGLAIVATILMIRNAYVPSSPTVRADVTKAVAYCAAAVLALITVDWNPHWAIRACITAAEVAIVFDIITVLKRPGADARG
jgi:phosphatidylserine synthase